MRNVNLLSVATTAPPSWPKKLTQTGNFYSLAAGLMFLLLLFAAPNYVNAQGCTTAWPGTTVNSSPANLNNPAITPTYSSSQNIGPGNFFYFNAYNGLSYEFFNCNSGNWDTDVLIYRNDNGGYLAGHDGFSTCGWRSSNNLWTSGYTGQVRVVMPLYANCAASYGWNNTLTSTVMQVRETAVPAPPTPTSDGNTCGNVTISRAAPPTGYTYYWQTSASGAVASNSNPTYTFTANGSNTVWLRTLSASGNWSGTLSSITVNVNAVPAATSVGITSGTSGQCGGSITLTASGGAGGTLSWSGTTSNGGIINTTNPQVVNATGTNTYYFRSVNNGCSGAEGAATVTINPVPAATTVAVTSGTSGQCGGNIQLTASGGAGGTLSWSGSTSNGSIINTLNPQTVSATGTNTYYFRSVSGAGCSGPQGSATVTINAIPAATTVAVTSGTSGQCGGSINLTASGGAGGTLSWSGSTSGGPIINTTNPQTVSATGTNTYYFRSVSAAGCAGAEGSSTVVINPVPAATTVAISSGASGQCGGTIQLTASGGSGGTIQWLGNVSGGPSINALNPQTVNTSDTYYFRSVSGAGCAGPQGSQAVVINIVPTVAGTTTGAGTYCTNGTVPISASGGTGTIYFQGTNSNLATATSTGLGGGSQNVSSSGTYYFRNQSAQGCWSATMASVTVTINSVPAAVTVTNASGNAFGCNGTATLNASGGAGGTIYWQNITSNGTSTATPSASQVVTSDNTYYFRSISGAGCPGPQGSFTVDVVPAVNLSNGAGTTQSTCGASNGTACVTATGGTGSFTYAWAGGGSSACKASVPSGSYQVTVTTTGGSGCNAVTSINVTDAGSPTATTNAQTNVSCFGGNNGSYRINVSGGTPPYDLVWSNGDLNFGVAAGLHSTSTGLSQGLISVDVTDANGCSSSASTTITQPTQLTVSVGSVTNVLCNGASTGAININVGGGTGTKTYAWTSGQTTEDITGRAAGTYGVTVTDANSCVASSTGIAITQPAVIAPTSTVTNVLCFGGNNGAIDLSVTGGVSPYGYAWSNTATSQDVSSLNSGAYSVVITDANSCTVSHARTITQPASGVSIAVTNVTNVSCFGGSNGAVTIAGSGGTAGYTYAINAGAFGPTATFSGLAAGSYTFRVRDANLCENSVPVTVSQPAATLIPTITSITTITCNGASTGAVDLSVAGGTPNYSYVWSNGATSQDLSNVVAGTYTVTITDFNSCTASISANVTQVGALSATASVTNVTSCQGFSNGAVTFTPAGGSGLYAYSINGGVTYQTSATFTGLAAGTYSPFIRDNSVPTCAVALAPFTVTQPASLPAPTLPGGSTYNSCGLLVVNVNPQGGATQAILHNAVPGVGTAIDTNTAFLFNNLTAGNYTFYTTSYNPTTQCQGTAFTSFTVAVVNPVLVAGSVTNVTCFGAQNGAVNITPSGGTGTYTYNWAHGPTTQDLVNVGGAAYNVVVTDAQGCFNIGSFRVVEFAPVNASINVSSINGYVVRCFGDSTAQLSVAATGGNGTYTYLWNDGSTQATRNDAYQGNFRVTVTDGQGCAIVKSTNLFQPPVLALSLQTSYFCSGGGYSSATVQVTPAGGQAPYQYSLNQTAFRQSSNTFSNLANGSTNTFYIFDANGCQKQATTTIAFPAPGSAVGSCDFIYVAPASEGGDVNNAGTPDCPTTLAQAMALVSPTRNYIRLLGGASQYTYSTPVDLVSNVTVEGGYTRTGSGAWVKNTSTPTILNFVNAYTNPAAGVGHYAGFISSGRSNWTLQDLTVNVQQSGAVGTQDGNGRSVYGLLINSSSFSYTLNNIIINTGNASNGANGTVASDGQNGVNGAAGSAGQFIQDNTGGAGPFPACCGGGTGGTGGNGGGTGGTGTADPGAITNGNASSCVPYGSPSQRGGGGGGSGGHGGSTSNVTVQTTPSAGRGGGGGLVSGTCGHNAASPAVPVNTSTGFIYYFYSQPQPAPVPSGVNGINGSNGSNASLSYTPGARPNIAALGQYFVPGKGANGGSGFGGAGGSGGGGTGAVIVDGRSGSPSFLNIVRGSGGGAGGSGAEGGQGGEGAGGGGSAFGVYVSSNSLGGASLTGVIVNSVGTGGIGGTGSAGGNGGTGGFGGQGGPAMSDAQLGIVLTSPAGNGGLGGNGGAGGRGQDGDNGTASAIYYGGAAAPAQTPVGSNGTVTVSTIKACTNSVIPITKTSNDNWTITGGNFVNNITNTTSSFNASSDTASIWYNSVGNKNISVGAVSYPSFIKVTGTRPLPVISSAPYGSVCQGSTINLTTSTTGLEYRWTVSNVDSPSVTLVTFAGPTINNVLVDVAGTFIIKLDIREECCGWSIPVYASVTVTPLPVTMPTINGAATVCAGQSVTYSAPQTLYAAANVNTTTGYKWVVPAGATITSAGGANGFISGGNINLTVTFGTNSGDITLTPSNACGNGAVTTKAITVAPTPVITGISGTNAMCSSASQVLTPVVTGGTGYTYLWSTGATTSSITVNPVVNTTYTVTVTNNPGTCFDVESKAITVSTTPAVAGAITGLSTAFYGQSGVSYSIAPVANATSYNWTVPSGASITSGQGTTSIVVNFGTATSGNVSVTPVNGTCSPAATNRFVTISAAPLVWTGNTNDEWFVTSNWSTNTVPIATSNIRIPGGRPNYPTQYSGAPVGNEMVIESGATVSLEFGSDMDLNSNLIVLSGATLQFPALAGSTTTLRVAGNVQLNGTVVAGTGKLLLDGTTAAQTISGTATIHHLELNNNNGASITSGMISVRGGLNLDGGVLTTNDRLTIKSDAAGTGWVDNFSAGMNGSISGDIIMQRFFPASANATAFHYISSPVNNGLVVANLTELALYGPDGGQVIPQSTCDPNNIASNSPYGNLFEYRENASFLFGCNQSGWHVRSGGVLTNGRGYAGIIRRASDFTLDIKGTANTGNIQYNNLANSGPIGDGWHIVSNPYPSPIEWIAPAGFVGAAHFFQSSGSYTGSYQPQLSGTGYQIAAMQGFFIQNTSGTPANFVMNQSNRRTGDPAFQRQANWYDHILNVELAGNNYADKTTVYFGADCSDNWDDMYDAQKKESRVGQPTLYTRIANYPKLVGINGLPTNNSRVVSVPMGMLAGANGTFTFTFTDMSTFAPSALIYLEDLKTGTIQNVRVNDTYTFTATISDDPERFIIHFYPPATIAAVEGDCEGKNGAINVDLGVFNVGGSILTWDSYELKDAAGIVVATSTNVNGAITTANLNAGTYTLNLNIQGYLTSETVTITAPAPVDAAYAPGFSTAYTQAILEFMNNSVNATNYTWTFGDGASSTLASPTHIYSAPGLYDVTLVANSDDCSDTYSTKVEVLEVAVGLPGDIKNPLVTITGYQDVVSIGFLNLNDPTVQIDIFDLSGRMIIETLTLETSQNNHQIKLNAIPSGYYFVRVSGANTYQDQKIFLTSEN